MAKTRKLRKAPDESATSLPEGTIKSGWVIKKASNGVPRWMQSSSVELNGFRLFTTDYAAKHIEKPITLYAREYKDMWPKKNAWAKPEGSTYVKLKFIASGDAIKQGTKILEWLKTQKPEIKKGTRFSIHGHVYHCTSKGDDYLTDVLQVDSSNGKIISTNLLNTELYVKV